MGDRVRVQFPRCRTFISVFISAAQGQLSLPSLRGQQMSTSFGWEGKVQWQVWFIPLADERGVCR